MRDNNLSELSKPVAYTDAEELRFHHATSDMWPTPLGFEKDAPLYSQEYVSALESRVADLERTRFIAWPGNMFAPVLARIKVDVRRRDGSVSVGQSGGNVVWYHQDKPDDVVAFALTPEGDA